MDSDQNPYNNSSSNILVSYTYTNSILAGNTYQVPINEPLSTRFDAKYLFARITDYKGYSRYYYLSQPFQVQATPPSFDPASQLPSGPQKFLLTGVAGDTYTIQATSDFLSWSNLTTVQNINGTVEFYEQQATNFPRRFYRALAF